MGSGTRSTAHMGKCDISQKASRVLPQAAAMLHSALRRAECRRLGGCKSLGSACGRTVSKRVAGYTRMSIVQSATAQYGMELDTSKWKLLNKHPSTYRNLWGSSS